MAGLAVIGELETAVADSWEVTPTLTLRQSYDDNFRLNDDKDKVWGTNLIGSLRVNRATEDLDINGLLRLDLVKYTGDTDNISDKNNQLFALNIDKRYTLDQFRVQGLFRRDTLLRRLRVHFEPTDVSTEPAQGVDTAVVPENVRQSVFIVNPSWTRKMTERLSSDLRYRFQNRSFENVDATQQLIDSRTHEVQGGFNYRLTEITDGLANITLQRFDPDQNPTTHNVSLRLGVTGDWDETRSYGIEIGPRYTQVARRGESDENDFGIGWLAFLETDLGEETRYRLEYERSLRASSNAKILETDDVSFNVFHSLTPRVELSMRSRLYTTNALGTSSSGTVKYGARVAPQLTYLISEHWDVDIGYVFRLVERSNQSRQTGNEVFVALNYSRQSIFDWF